MGSGVNRYVKGARLAGWLAMAVVILAAGPIRLLNHSFDIQTAGRLVCTDGVVVVGEAIAPSSLNKQMTSEVYDATGTTVLATGDTHTFTAVGETFTFTVLGTFNLGDTVAISVGESPGTAGGTEGDVVTETVANCSLDICGDGNLDPGETCDPADPAAPVGCRPIGDAEECTFCGDNNVEASEACDDGNSTNGDGCESDCTPTAVPTLGEWGAVVLALVLLALAMLAGGGALLAPGGKRERQP
jgi:cysteine-rich repeat protein